MSSTSFVSTVPLLQQPVVDVLHDWVVRVSYALYMGPYTKDGYWLKVARTGMRTCTSQQKVHERLMCSTEVVVSQEHAHALVLSMFSGEVGQKLIVMSPRKVQVPLMYISGMPVPV